MHLDNPRLLKRIISARVRLRLENFVETGYGTGRSFETMLDLGFDCYSCDVDPKAISIAQHEGHDIAALESKQFLLDTCCKLKTPTLFWLDAHFPDPGIAGDSWPIEKELLVIKNFKRGLEHDLILCDDMKDTRVQPNPLAYAKRFLATHDWELWADGNILALVPKR